MEPFSESGYAADQDSVDIVSLASGCQPDLIGRYRNLPPDGMPGSMDYQDIKIFWIMVDPQDDDRINCMRSSTFRRLARLGLIRSDLDIVIGSILSCYSFLVSFWLTSKLKHTNNSIPKLLFGLQIPGILFLFRWFGDSLLYSPSTRHWRLSYAWLVTRFLEHWLKIKSRRTAAGWHSLEGPPTAPAKRLVLDSAGK